MCRVCAVCVAPQEQESAEQAAAELQSKLAREQETRAAVAVSVRRDTTRTRSLLSGRLGSICCHQGRCAPPPQPSSDLACAVIQARLRTAEESLVHAAARAGSNTDNLRCAHPCVWHHPMLARHGRQWAGATAVRGCAMMMITLRIFASVTACTLPARW